VVSWDGAREAYDIVASKYEERFLDELDHKPRDRELLDAFADAVEDPVLDVGCGPGQIGVYVRNRGRLVIGLDLSHEMVRLANHRLNSVLTADMRGLPIAPSSVGGILSFYSLIHLPRAQIGATLREFRRVLRRGGRLLLSAHEGDGEVQADEFLGEAVHLAGTFFTLDELVTTSTAAGLEVVHAERRQPYPLEGDTVRLYLEVQRPHRD
jgi:SAM-dependent methyltransferase